MALLEHPVIPPHERAAEWAPSEVRRVVVRLADGDAVQVGTAPNRHGAMVLARSVIAELEGPPGSWPVVGDRLIRPEAVVSVDVVRI